MPPNIPNIISTFATPIPNAIGGNIDYERTSGRSELLSGIEINQNVTPTNSTDFVVPSGVYYYQQFKLPTNYTRAASVLPDLTGVQVCVNVSKDPTSVTFEYILLASGVGAKKWETLASGVVHGIHTNGVQIWADIYFNQNVQVTEQLKNSSFRIGIRTVNVDGWWFSSPNPYAYGNALNYNLNNLEASFMFRLLAYTADAGTDWLGNTYRNAVFNNSAKNINTFSNNAPNSYWLSKPNPSKFAIESLYFDISEGKNASVIDRILLEPITPGVSFHVYYSSEGEPVNTPLEWDNKLWTPVPQKFNLTKREIFALPTPITARYICLEFSKLQSQYYAPGTYQQPVIYRKYPQWIYNYFINNSATQTLDPMISSQINVVYNKLQLGFDYYLDDLNSQPLSPSDIIPEQEAITLSSPEIHPRVLSKINTNLAPYTLPIGNTVTGNSVLSNFARTSVSNFSYPIEAIKVPTLANGTTVSVPNREAVLTEQQMPDLYFFLNCRHNYHFSQAEFEYDRGYFVGIKNAAFLRADYHVPADEPLYIETAGDNQNAVRNDFYSVNNAWQVINVP